MNVSRGYKKTMTAKRRGMGAKTIYIEQYSGLNGDRDNLSVFK